MVQYYFIHLTVLTLTDPECLKALAHARMNQRRDRITAAEAGTNHWIWGDEVYKQFESQKSAILWIHGKPGSGKSVLATSIVKKLKNACEVDNEEPNRLPVICSWFYSKRDDLQSHLIMLRAIIRQILQQDEPSFRYMTSLYRRRGPYNEDSSWTSKELLEVLKNIVSNSQAPQPILCILDGLDESYKNKNEEEIVLSDVLDVISDLIEKSSNFKVVLLSRTDSDIKDKLGSYGKICMQTANSVDINRVINKGLLSLITQVNSGENDLEESDDFLDTAQQTLLHTSGRRRSIPNEQIIALFDSLDCADSQCCYRIRDYLIHNADGVFLWVKTIISALELSATEPFCSLADIEAELYNLPQEDLDNLYADIVEKLKSSLKTDSGKAKAKRALIWTAVHARSRSLRLPYLLDALSIDDDIQRALSRPSDPLKCKKVRSVAKFERELQGLCGPFLEIVPASVTRSQLLESRGNDLMQCQVQLLHQTVNDFLERDPRADFLRIPSNAVDVVKTDSLAYLQTALPQGPTKYDPLSIIRNRSISKVVEAVLLYLQEKILLPFILVSYPQMGWSIPNRYRDIFRSIASLLQGTDQYSSQNAAEEFFLRACLDGQVLALENLLRIQFVYPVEECNDFVTECYRYEVPAIRGALRAAVRGGLKNEIDIFAWYIGVRGLNILESAAGDADAIRKNVVIKEALESSDPKTLLELVGYRDKDSMLDLLKRFREIQTSMVSNVYKMDSSRKVVPFPNVREAIRFTIGVWCVPSQAGLISQVISRFSAKDALSDRDYGFFGPGTDEHNDQSRYIELQTPATGPLDRLPSLSTNPLRYLTNHRTLRTASRSINQYQFLQKFGARSLSHTYLCTRSASVNAMLKYADRKNKKNPIVVYIRSNQFDKYQARRDFPGEFQTSISDVESNIAKFWVE